MDIGQEKTEVLFDLSPLDAGNNFIVGGLGGSTEDTKEEEKEKEEKPNKKGAEPDPNFSGESPEEDAEGEDDDESDDDAESDFSNIDEEDEEDDDEGGYEDYSGPALLAKNFIKEGLLPSDLKVGKEMTAKELADAIKGHYVDGSVLERELKLKEAGLDDDTIEYAKFLAAGGNPGTVKSHSIYTQLAEVELDDNEEQKTSYLRYYLTDKGIDENYIENIIDKAIIDDTLDDEIEKAKGYFSEKSKTVIAEEKKKIQKEKEEKERTQKENEDKLKNIINSGKIGNVALSKDEAKQFEKDFFLASEIWKDKDGTTHKVTKYRKRMLELQDDPEKTLELVYYILNGTKKVKQSIKQEVTEDFLSALDGKTVASNNKNKKRGSKTPWIGSLDTTRLL
jgi:hypothetical protein